MTERDGRSAGTLRPIEQWEYIYVEALGLRIRDLRLESSLTQKVLASAAGLNPASLRRIELGRRRTRASTLRRIVGGLGFPISKQQVILQELIELAGPALASESRFYRPQATSRDAYCTRAHDVTESP